MSIPQTPDPRDPIAGAVEFLEGEIRSAAQEIDADQVALRQALGGMAARGFLGLRVPREYGGAELAEVDFRRFQEACARVSGCLAFLQTQHQSACSMLAKSDNDVLKQEYLPRFATGSSLCGIAFSQLRRKSATPVLAAIETAGGYLLEGAAPWITGLGFFDYCVTAATLTDGTTVFLLHPLTDDDGLTLTEPMKLASME